MANTTQSGSPQANLVGNGGGESLRDRFSKITQDMDWIKASLVGGERASERASDNLSGSMRVRLGLQV